MKTTIPPKKTGKEKKMSDKDMAMEEAAESDQMEQGEQAQGQDPKISPEMQKRIDKLKAYTSGNVDALQK